MRQVMITRVHNGGFVVNFIDPETAEEYRNLVSVYAGGRDGVEELLDDVQSHLDIDNLVTEYVPRENKDNLPVTRQLVTGYFTSDELMDIVTNLRYNERGRVPTQCCEEGVAPGCCDVPLKEGD